MPRKPALTLTWNGVTKSYLDWALKTGVSADSIRSRIKQGWSVDEALTKGPQSRGNVAKTAADARWKRVKQEKAHEQS